MHELFIKNIFNFFKIILYLMLSIYQSSEYFIKNKKIHLIRK